MRLCLSFVFLIQFAAIIADATDRYVVEPGTIENGEDLPPYNTWTNAATNIQWAVNEAVAGETVLVSNGTYWLTNQISFTKGITVRSVNGRDVTTINGNYPAYTNRCFYVYSTNAFVHGFTITNGYSIDARGGGVYLSWGPTISNCNISGNTALKNGGGGLAIHGSGTANYCNIYGNVATGAIDGGGGVYLTGGPVVVTNCAIAWNTAIPTQLLYSGQGGGGVYIAAGGVVQNCVISSNAARNAGAGGSGGGMMLYYDGNVINSIISENTNNANGGAGVVITGRGNLQGCLIKNNQSQDGDGSGLKLEYNDGYIRNCTIAGNKGVKAGMYVRGSSSARTMIENCIVWSNYTYSGVLTNLNLDYTYTLTNISFSNCCIYPTNFPTAATNISVSGCISNNPAFVDYSAGNYRLEKSSPCINTGANRDWMTGAVDLDGRMRIRYGTVDMGAYEAVHNATFYRFY